MGTGLGLLILGIPLALPLAVLILFGGLFPIVGAAATGVLSILVALVLGLVVLEDPRRRPAPLTVGPLVGTFG